ncbi:adenine deaminase 2 [Aspergillus udagawae]|uniref:Adenine deaminase 2 n=1 Tax=Aspergillus udagawae TaxID=91492 RepID=A0ABQ1BFE8_9EURO|nr:adenine deaminase 2 [Aspergillus udagawae]
MTRFIVFSAVLALAAACNVPEHLRREPPAKTVINNVHVFDGNKFSSQTSLVIVGGLISNAPAAGAYNVVDGAGGYLIPGLIDSHCHITDCSYLTTMRQYGITTALEMGTYPYSALSACKAQGVTDIRGSGAAATVHGTAISHAPGFPTDSFVSGPEAAQRFVADRTAEGADYIKVFLDTLGPDESTVAAIVTAAHEHNKLVISHATDHAAFAITEAAGVDIPCHAPMDKPLDASDTAALLLSKSVVVPTLIMMQSVTNNTGAPLSVYNNAAKASVTAMHEAGVPIVAGSDANASPFVPANPPFGDSLHDELELLVEAGLSPVEALRGATSTAASTFRLHDRGAIRTGLRADLVLLGADPTVDIRNTRANDKVWVEGVQAEL